ncbi:MAG: hypothetical protein RL596_2698 [Bacteroidota bacterium]|jgi:hypothetical protein
MHDSIIYKTEASVLCVILMVLMTLMVYVGYWLRKRRQQEYEGMGSIEGSSFGLLGLILAFTFGMSANRYDNRRAVVVDEVNNLAGAMLRVETFDNDSLKHALYVDFKDLLDQRIKTNVTKVFDPQYDSARIASYNAVRKLIRHSNQLAKIDKYNYAAMQLIQSLIKVNDSVTLRYNTMNATVPDAIIWLLIIFALSCSVFAGFSLPVSKKINWLPILSFIVFTCVVIYIILDMDRPKRGFITIADQYSLVKDLVKMLPKDLEK